MRRLLALVSAAVLTGCVGASGSRSAASLSAPATPTAPSASSPIQPEPAFSIDRLRGEVRDEVIRKNWHPGCPVGLEDLRVLTVKYWGFDGRVKSGPLVSNASVASDVRWVFRRLFRAGFPIKHVDLARKFHPPTPLDYERTRDVTASFNCRPVTDGTSLSQHSYGWAIDINPLQNPYIRGDGSALRRAAKAYIDRSQDLPGMIHPGDIVVRSFARIGWEWGGDWTSIKDYMHFSLTGT